MPTIETFQIGVKALIKNNLEQVLLVHIPEWGGNAAHWDLPGGRMDKGETFIDALRRELNEEIGVVPIGNPKQLTATLTNITIPTENNIRMPLVYILYEVIIAPNSEVSINPSSDEDQLQWVNASDLPSKLSYKYSKDFCNQILNYLSQDAR